MRVNIKGNLRGILLIYVLIAISLSGYSQKLQYYENPKYGTDSISRVECAKNLSNMSSFVKIDMFDYAYSSWRYCFINCPAASKNIYIMGSKILKDRIENSEDEKVKDQYIDTLMMLYDQRIQYFKQEGYVLGWKGVDLLKYRTSDIETAYEYLQKSVDLRKVKSEEAVIITLMQATNILYKNKIKSEDDIINNYIKLSEYLTERLNNTRSPDKTQLAIENVEKIFTECGAAGCEAISDIFTPKFEANRTDFELLKKITIISEKNKCTESGLYLDALEELFKIEPSSALAAKIAQLSHAGEEYNKCTAYFKKALELETDNETKARLYTGLAQITVNKFKNYPKARDYAYEAIKVNGSFGDPYILIGNAYVAGSDDCNQSKFEQRAVYWAAVDKYKKAKSIDPSISNIANELIDKYSGYFPLKEEAFFNGYVDGQEYTVGGWINEKTIVRTKEN